MAKPKKNYRPHVEPREAFHIPRRLHAAFIRYVDDRRPPSNKTEVLRLALREFLEREGYWTVGDDPEEEETG